MDDSPGCCLTLLMVSSRLRMTPKGEQCSESLALTGGTQATIAFFVSDELKAPGPSPISLHRSGKQSPQELQQSRRPINDDIGLVGSAWGLRRIYCNP